MSLVRVNLLYMSFYGGILVLIVLFLRLLLKSRLPKRTFSILWCVALLRLLAPVAVEAPFSIVSALQDHLLADRGDSPGDFLTDMFQAELSFGEKFGSGEISGSGGALGYPEAIGGNLYDRNAAGIADGHSAGSGLTGSGFFHDLQEQSLLRKMHIAGSAICWIIFLALYLNCLRRFKTALPLKNAFLEQWLERNRPLRKVRICQSDRISSPLTYGVVRPVILLPRQMVQEDGHKLEYILQHELVHIRRCDGAWKFAMAAALCLHWFNPLVWVMYVFMNRDLELSCDEEVLRIFGTKARKGYALTLIGMEEARHFSMPLYSGFGKNAVEERVGEIMKYKKKTKITVAIASMLILMLGCMFATTSRAGTEPLEADRDLSGTALPDALLMDPPVGNFGGNAGVDSNADLGTATGADPYGGSGNAGGTGLPVDGESDYRLIYMKEGMPESEPAQMVTGQGYSILLPREGWTAFDPDGWMSEVNHEVELWVAHFSAEDSDYYGFTREQVVEALQEEGYQEENGRYWMYEGANDRMTVVELHQAGDQDFWGVVYTYPGEAEDGWGVELRAMAQTFSCVAPELAESASGEKYAAYYREAEERALEAEMAGWLLQRLEEAFADHGSIDQYLAEGYDVDTGILDVIREWDQGDIHVRSHPSDGHCVTAVLVKTTESEEDSNDYLTVELVKEGEDWKICFMGLEK